MSTGEFGFDLVRFGDSGVWAFMHGGITDYSLIAATNTLRRLLGIGVGSDMHLRVCPIVRDRRLPYTRTKMP